MRELTADEVARLHHSADDYVERARRSTARAGFARHLARGRGTSDAERHADQPERVAERSSSR